MIDILLYILTILLAFLLVFSTIFRPFLDIRNKFSANIIESIIPDIQSSIKLLITLSASAFVLTFTVLQYLKDKELHAMNHLVNSWGFFTFSMLFGVGSSMIIYMLRAQIQVTLNEFKRKREGEAVIKEELENFLSGQEYYQNILFALILAQAVFFLCAFASLFTFARINFSG